jgi:hypothetical protein
MRHHGPRPAPRSLAVFFAALLAFGLSASAAAQGLGSAAARERQRREKTKAPSAPVFTNDDLPSSGDTDDTGDAEEGSGVSDDEVTPPSSEPPVEPVDPVRAELDREREKRALAERDWRARFAEARARVAEAEERCWQDVIRTEFYNGIPVQVRVKEFVETEEYRRTKQELADLEEEFRRTGLPPGWARE